MPSPLFPSVIFLTYFSFCHPIIYLIYLFHLLIHLFIYLFTLIVIIHELQHGRNSRNLEGLSLVML